MAALLPPWAICSKNFLLPEFLVSAWNQLRWQHAEAAKKQLRHWERTSPMRWGMPGAVAPAPHTRPAELQGPGPQGDVGVGAGGPRARGTGKVSVPVGPGLGAQGRCRYRQHRREEEPGPAPGGAALLGPAALRKRRGGRAVRRPWVSEGGEGGREGPRVTVPAGRARTQPGAASAATSLRELPGSCSGGCVCRSWPPPQPRPSPPRKVLLLSAICLRLLS